jgi:transcriptional regulator of acetoin/glycerol metabolism
VTNRRTFIKSAAACGPAAILTHQGAGASEPSKLILHSIPVGSLPQQFDVEPGIHNLENGSWGIMPRCVKATMGNISAAARLLGMHRRSLQRKLVRQPPHQRDPGEGPFE